MQVRMQKDAEDNPRTMLSNETAYLANPKLLYPKSAQTIQILAHPRDRRRLKLAGLDGGGARMDRLRWGVQ